MQHYASNSRGIRRLINLVFGFSGGRGFARNIELNLKEYFTRVRHWPINQMNFYRVQITLPKKIFDVIAHPTVILNQPENKRRDV